MSGLLYPLLPIISFLGFAASITPFAWFLRFPTPNPGIWIFMFWTAVVCLNQFVNSIIWNDSTANLASGWCLFSSRLIIAGAVGLPAAGLCILRRLHKSVSNDSPLQKRRVIVEDVMIGVGLPLLHVLLQCILSGRRFYIIEGVGCYPSTPNVWLSYLFVFSWPVVVGFVSLLYAILSLVVSFREKSHAESRLSKLPVSKDHQLCLFFTAFVQATVGVPLSLAFLCLTLTSTSLEPVSSINNESELRPQPMPIEGWRVNSIILVGLAQTVWLPILLAFIHFALSILTREARTFFVDAIWSVIGLFGVRRTIPNINPIRFSIRKSYPPRTSSGGPVNILVSQEKVYKRDTIFALSSLGQQSPGVASYAESGTMVDVMRTPIKVVSDLESQSWGSSRLDEVEDIFTALPENNSRPSSTSSSPRSPRSPMSKSPPSALQNSITFAIPP